jgi:hypothetical protein
MDALTKRYRRELMLALTAYVIVMLFVWPLARSTEATGSRLLLAMTPLLPFALALRAMLRHVRDSDELQRRLHLEALAISALIVSFASMSAGFLVAARIIALDGTVLLWVFPALALLFGTLRCWLAARYARE